MTASDGVVDFYKRINEKREYIKTKYSSIDKRAYISKGDYIVIGGRPSNGKTAFALSLMLNFARSGHKVVFFSLETSKEKIFDRIMANVSSVNLTSIKTGSFKKNETEEIMRALDRLGELNITVVNASGYSVEKIRAKALKLKADIIFIDYIGLVGTSGSSRYEKVTNISVALHTMAQQFGIVTIALSQLRRNDDGIPKMSDLRESGQIEQDADLIFLVHDDNNEEKEYHVIIAKNKEGRTGAICMKFFKDTQQIIDL